MLEALWNEGHISKKDFRKCLKHGIRQKVKQYSIHIYCQISSRLTSLGAIKVLFVSLALEDGVDASPHLSLYEGMSIHWSVHPSAHRSIC